LKEMRSIPGLEHFLPTLMGHFAHKGKLSTDISLSAIQPGGRLDGGVKIIPTLGEFGFGPLKLMVAHALSKRVFYLRSGTKRTEYFPTTHQNSTHCVGISTRGCVQPFGIARDGSGDQARTFLLVAVYREKFRTH
jgi:hypothetical protein